jgi:hypothetical protein
MKRKLFFYINLLYHYGHIESSLFKEELIAYPIEDQTFYNKISEQELPLL